MNRSIIGIALLTLSPMQACLVPTIVASQDASPSTDGAGSMDASSEAGGGTTTSPVQTCPQGVTNQSSGTGFNSLRPGECVAARGPDHALASIAEISALLPGTWTVCSSGSILGLPVADGRAKGIELRADNSYVLLMQTPQFDLVAQVPQRTDGGVDAGWSTPLTGTYEIVDGSATFGVGSYAIRLHPAGGGVAYGQIVVTDSPRQLHFFAPGASDAPLAPALPWAPFSPICQCIDATGSKVSPTDPAALGAAITGRWLGCGGVTSFGGQNSVGIEFTADGYWYSLNEDRSGALVRGPDRGAYQLSPTSNPSDALPEPLTLELGRAQGGNLQTQVIATTTPRALRLNVGYTSSDTGTTPIYGTMMPIQ